jgi:wee1-like protein kinase
MTNLQLGDASLRWQAANADRSDLSAEDDGTMDDIHNDTNGDEETFSDSEEGDFDWRAQHTRHAPLVSQPADEHSPSGKLRRVGSTCTPRRVLSPPSLASPLPPTAPLQMPSMASGELESFTIKSRTVRADSSQRSPAVRGLRTKSHDSNPSPLSARRAAAEAAAAADEPHLSDLAASRYCYVASDAEDDDNDKDNNDNDNNNDDLNQIGANDGNLSDLNSSFKMSTVKTSSARKPNRHKRSNSAGHAENADDVEVDAVDWLARHNVTNALLNSRTQMMSPRDVDDSAGDDDTTSGGGGGGVASGARGRALFGGGAPRTAYKKRARAPREPTTADITFPVSLIQHTNIFTPDSRGGRKPAHIGGSGEAPRTAHHKLLAEEAGERASSAPATVRLRLQPSTLYGALFVEEELLGEGSFGRVYRCRHRLDGALYAVKISKQPLRRAKQFAQSGGQVEKAALREAWALAALPSSKHVLRYYSAWYEQGHLYIQTELCEGGTLEQHKKLNAIWSEDALCNILRQVTKGLHALHSRGFVHLDIKPENIYISLDDDPDAPAAAEPTCTFKLGDLGLMCRGDEHIDHEGDSRYLARDLLQDDAPDNFKCDIFSLGISIYELASGRPLPKEGDAWRELREGHVPALPYGYSNQFRRMLARMMHPIAFSRPSTADLLREPLLLSSTEKELLHLKELLVAAGIDPSAPKPPTRAEMLQRRVSTTMSLNELQRYNELARSSSSLNAFGMSASTSPVPSWSSSPVVSSAPPSMPSSNLPTPVAAMPTTLPTFMAPSVAAAGAAAAAATATATAASSFAAPAPQAAPMVVDAFALKPQVRVPDNDPSPLLPRRKSIRAQKVPEIHNNMRRSRSGRGSFVLADRLPDEGNVQPKESLPTPLKDYRWHTDADKS